MRKFAISVGAAAVVLVLIGLIFQTWRIGGLKEKIEEDQAVMDSLNNRVAVADSFAAAVDSTAEREIDRLGLEVEKLEGRLTFTQDAADEAEDSLDTIVAALPDSVKKEVARAVSLVQRRHDDEMLVTVNLLANVREQLGLRETQLAAQRNLNRELQAALAEANVQINFYQNKVTSPFSFNIKADFVKVSLAFVGGMILKKAID